MILTVLNNLLRNVHKYIFASIMRCNKAMTFTSTKAFACSCLLWWFRSHLWSSKRNRYSVPQNKQMETMKHFKMHRNLAPGLVVPCSSLFAWLCFFKYSIILLFTLKTLSLLNCSNYISYYWHYLQIIHIFLPLNSYFITIQSKLNAIQQSNNKLGLTITKNLTIKTRLWNITQWNWLALSCPIFRKHFPILSTSNHFLHSALNSFVPPHIFTEVQHLIYSKGN